MVVFLERFFYFSLNLFFDALSFCLFALHFSALDLEFSSEEFCAFLRSRFFARFAFFSPVLESAFECWASQVFD